MSDSIALRQWNDPRNITVGLGRIIYAPWEWTGCAEGWVLPGGRRTQDEDEARKVAAAIDQMSR